MRRSENLVVVYNKPMLPVRPLPSEVVLLPENARRVFEGVLFDVYQFPQPQFDGTTKTFEMLKRPDTVLILPVTPEGKLWAIREQQPGKAVRNLRVPGGRVDSDDESVWAAAQRECEEEIGVQFHDWYYVESFQPETKIDWLIHIFVAMTPKAMVPTRHDAGEKIEVYTCSFEEFKQALSPKERRLVFETSATLDDLVGRAQRLPRL